MQQDIVALMKKPFPIVVALGIGAQLTLTTFMIWYCQGGTLHPRSAMAATEPETMYQTLLKEHPAENAPYDDDANPVVNIPPLNPRGPLLQDHEMAFLLRRRESGRVLAQSH